MMGTGFRLGELLAVKYENIDLKRRKATVTGSISRFGEGPTKTPGSARVIDLIDAVAPVIESLRSQLTPPRINGPVFANASGGFIDLTNWRDRNWRGLLAPAAVPYRGPNALRHTYAIAMIEAGYDPSYIARQMGHTSTQMIFRHYGGPGFARRSGQDGFEQRLNGPVGSKVGSFTR